MLFDNIQIKSFMILCVLRRSMQRVCGAHLRVIAPLQHSFFRRNVAMVVTRWQDCVRLDESYLVPSAPETNALSPYQLAGLITSCA